MVICAWRALLYCQRQVVDRVPWRCRARCHRRPSRADARRRSSRAAPGRPESRRSAAAALEDRVGARLEDVVADARPSLSGRLDRQQLLHAPARWVSVLTNSRVDEVDRVDLAVDEVVDAHLAIGGMVVERDRRRQMPMNSRDHVLPRADQKSRAFLPIGDDAATGVLASLRMKRLARRMMLVLKRAGQAAVGVMTMTPLF